MQKKNKPSSYSKQKRDWFSDITSQLSKQSKYEKPPMISPHNNVDIVKLDSNENYVIPKQFQLDIIRSAKKNIDTRQYPLNGTERLIDTISKHLKVPSSCIGVGNGSDQILDQILANFASHINNNKPKRILVSDPTFAFFKHRCDLYDIPQVTIPFKDDMTLDADDFIQGMANSDILYLDSPNNPTGFQFSKKDIIHIIKEFEASGRLVILDEAYGEFGDYSLASITKRYNNVIIVRTFSKSYGLAGLRLGYVIANKAFIDVFNGVVQYPYPVNVIAIEAGIQALQHSTTMDGYINVIKQQRDRIIHDLRQYDDAFTVFDSHANFVLFDAKGADRRIHKALSEQGISIRHLGKIGSSKGCLRVTVGTPDMNSKFLLAIRDLLR